MNKAQKNYQFSWFDWFCLIYPPAWLILFNRHWQKYHDSRDSWYWWEYLLFLIPFGFYIAVLLRWLRGGFREDSQQNYQFEATYQVAFREEIALKIIRYYFQGELHQLENLPTTGPLIVAMNHAGMCFPWDFLVLGCLLGNERNWLVHPLANTSLFEHNWIKLWLPLGWTKVMGGVKAATADLEKAVADQIILLYAPEGLRGPQKGWQKRYQLQTFHPSFIKLSEKYQIPILPVVCLGNEYLHPWAFNWQYLAEKLNLPFLPISLLMLLLLIFPSLGVWCNRSHLRYYIQPLYQPWQEVKLHKNQRSNSYEKAQKLREQLQQINAQ